jgi:streptogramin lyase
MRLFLRCLILSALGVMTLAPAGTAQEDGRHYLFVSSRNDSSVKRFDGMTGEFIDSFIESGAGGLEATQGVAFGPDGDLYVSGRGNAHILRFNGTTGAFLGAFTWGYRLENPTKMTFGPDGMLYVSQWGRKHSAVARFDALTGAFVDEATSVPLQEGMAHTWDGEGRVYVASYGSKDVKRFDQEGHLIDVFVTSEHLASAVNLWFGEDGDLFVVDWEAGSVLRYDGSTGEYVGVFISGMTRSEGVALGPDGAIYVCDWQENTVHRYDAKTGEHLGIFATGGGMMQPNGVAFNSVER